MEAHLGDELLLALGMAVDRRRQAATVLPDQRPFEIAGDPLVVLRLFAHATPRWRRQVSRVLRMR